MVKIFTATADHYLDLTTHRVRCALGKGGVLPSGDKREGDGATPLGDWPIRYVLYRADRIAKPETRLDANALSPDDGWCDAPEDPLYNRPVKLPFFTSHERLWRDDHVYDIIVVLGHNDDPVVPSMGSAIFLHVARDAYEGTEGCVALRQDHLLELLRLADKDAIIRIVP
jgi:L,D-peptidoglycan transpeptidase YkuD (ErfK/YbiS/YcfS/YnhG family)